MASNRGLAVAYKPRVLPLQDWLKVGESVDLDTDDLVVTDLSRVALKEAACSLPTLDCEVSTAHCGRVDRQMLLELIIAVHQRLHDLEQLVLEKRS